MSANQQQMRHARAEEAAAARVARDEVLYYVELGNGLAVKVGETTGFDEMLVLKKLGKEFTATGAGAFAYRNAMIARSIKRVRRGPAPDPENDPQGGEWTPFDRTKSEEFMTSLLTKEKARLEATYSAVNELTDEERSDLKNALAPSIES